jgi:hypothetical protein
MKTIENTLIECATSWALRTKKWVKLSLFSAACHDVME